MSFYCSIQHIKFSLDTLRENYNINMIFMVSITASNPDLKRINFFYQYTTLDKSLWDVINWKEDILSDAKQPGE